VHVLTSGFIVRYVFLDNKIMSVVTTWAGGIVAVCAVAYCSFKLRGQSAHIADECVDRCTWLKSTRPNPLLRSVLDGGILMAVRQQSVQFAVTCCYTLSFSILRSIKYSYILQTRQYFVFSCCRPIQKKKRVLMAHCKSRYSNIIPPL
jgi:hypothetical protein